MEHRILRKLFLGFIQVHILYHAGKEPVYGVYMIEELKRHGYKVSAGTIYPILHSMVEDGLLSVEKKVVNGKLRKYSTITPEGKRVLEEARKKAEELVRELREE